MQKLSLKRLVLSYHRMMEQKLAKFFQSSHYRFDFNNEIFPISHQTFGLLVYETLTPTPLKNSPIWSHWSRTKKDLLACHVGWTIRLKAWSLFKKDFK